MNFKKDSMISLPPYDQMQNGKDIPNSHKTKWQKTLPRGRLFAELNLIRTELGN